jgi:hypothetical protein
VRLSVLKLQRLPVLEQVLCLPVTHCVAVTLPIALMTEDLNLPCI